MPSTHSFDVAKSKPGCASVWYYRLTMAELTAKQAEMSVLKRLQVETAAELDALLPAIPDKAFKGES
jgi:hypothetical protein